MTGSNVFKSLSGSVIVDRGLWGYELRGERAKEAAEDLAGRYDRLDRLAAYTPSDLNYQDETDGWIAEIENKYNVTIKIY